MRSPVALLFATLLSILLVLATADSTVVELTDDNFDVLTEGKKLSATGDWFIEVYQPDCERCRLLEAEYEAFAQKAKGHLSVARVDGAANPFLRRRLGTKSYPHFVLLRKGYYFTYTGPQTVEKFMEFATVGHRTASSPRRLPPPPTMLELLSRDYDRAVRDFDTLIVSHRPLLLGIFATGGVLGFMIGLICGACCCGRTTVVVAKDKRD